MASPTDNHSTDGWFGKCFCGGPWKHEGNHVRYHDHAWFAGEVEGMGDNPTLCGVYYRPYGYAHDLACTLPSYHPGGHATRQLGEEKVFEDGPKHAEVKCLCKGCVDADGRVTVTTRKQERIAFLERHRDVIQAHMQTRAQDADWHGVSDDANDLREVDAELRGLRFKDE